MHRDPNRILIQREHLVQHLKAEGYIKSEIVEKAFLKTPREKFVPDRLITCSYVDTPLEIGEGQTISAPHMVAIMCETLDVKKGQEILEIGAGSGYHAAIVSHLVGDTGHIYSIERLQSLAETIRGCQGLNINSNSRRLGRSCSYSCFWKKMSVKRYN